MSKDRSGLYNIHGAVFQVIRGVTGDCLSLGDHDGGTRISGPKPWGGGSMIAEFEVDEEYGPIGQLEAENSKLRELVRDMWDFFCVVPDEPHVSKEELDFSVEVWKRMRELGIGVG